MKEVTPRTNPEAPAWEFERKLAELVDLAERLGYARAAEGLRSIADVLLVIEHDLTE